MEMDSHEERLHNMIQESKREAAKEEAGRRAKELREKQKEAVRVDAPLLSPMPPHFYLRVTVSLRCRDIPWMCLFHALLLSWRKPRLVCLCAHSLEYRPPALRCIYVCALSWMRLFCRFLAKRRQLATLIRGTPQASHTRTLPPRTRKHEGRVDGAGLNQNATGEPYHGIRRVVELAVMFFLVSCLSHGFHCKL